MGVHRHIIINTRKHKLVQFFNYDRTDFVVDGLERIHDGGLLLKIGIFDVFLADVVGIKAVGQKVMDIELLGIKSA